MIPLIYIPGNRASGSAFYRLAHEWRLRHYVTLKASNNPYFWWGNIGDILLYDRPSLKWLTPGVPYRAGLFANAVPPVNGRPNLTWTFWPQYVPIVDAYARFPASLARRRFRCAFIGASENDLQRCARWMDYWRPACDLFHYQQSMHGNSLAYRNEEYVRLIRQARYGLCVPGFGSKCHREIEYMALGVVPIFTPGCNVTYAYPPQERTHYFTARTVEDVQAIVEHTPDAAWQSMSDACRVWYHCHASIPGSFLTTQSVIQSLYEG